MIVEKIIHVKEMPGQCGGRLEVSHEGRQGCMYMHAHAHTHACERERQRRGPTAGILLKRNLKS